VVKDLRGPSSDSGTETASSAPRTAPGKRTRTDQLVQLAASPVAALLGGGDAPTSHGDTGGGGDDRAGAPPAAAPDPFDWRALTGPLVQQRGAGAEQGTRGDVVHAAAATGVATPATKLPHRQALQASFGDAHDLSGVRAHVGGAAAESASAMGATAYATGNDVVLPENPSLHLVAHEVTHVVQQRAGVHLAGGVGAAGDPYEREADAIADAVVRGEHVGDRLPGGGVGGGSGGTVSGPSIQRKDPDDGAGADTQLAAWVEPMLLALLSMPVARDDAKAAKRRVDAILGTVKALHRPQRKLLLARLSRPKPGDQLAELFEYQLARASRKRVLAILRDETPAATEEDEDEQKPAEKQPGADAADEPADGVDVGSGKTAATGTNEMWRQVIGEKSTPVGKMARVRAPKGLRLRTRPAPGEPDVGIMPFDELVQVERRTEHGWCWVVSMGSMTGKTGFCEEQFLSIDPPEPTAHLYRVQAGDTLGAIASTYYGKNFRGGNDARLYVQALYEANKAHKGVYLDKVDLDLGDTWHRAEDEERTLEVFKGAKVREGLAIWVPSEAFIQKLKASGAITSGSSELSKAWRKAAAFVDDAIEAVKYAAGFIVGLLEGAWGAIVDLFKGAADMIEAVAKVVYHLVTGNPGAIKDMLMGWVKKLKVAWQNRDKLADAFMKKWEADDGWDRGRFQGEVLGWVMMTALITIVTLGEATAPMIAGKWGTVLKALKALDALGDVGTYAGAVGRLPGKAYDAVAKKVGKGADKAGDAADAVADGAGKGAKQAPDGPDVRSGVPEDPGPVLRGGTLDARQQELLERLAKADEWGPGVAKIGKREVTATDLAALTKHTGREHAMVILKDNTRVLVDLGSYKGGSLPANTKTLLMHAHPEDYGSGMAKFISKQDVDALLFLNQRYSYMVTVDGTVYRFTMNTTPNTVGEVVRKFHPVLGWVSQ